MAAAWRQMSNAMRNAPLRRLVIALSSVLVIFAAFAASMGMYAGALAFCPLVLVWWPRLLAGAVAVVALGVWWLWWRLPKRQMRSITAADPKARADLEDNLGKTITQLFAGLMTLFAGIVALSASAAVVAYLQLSQQQKSSHDLLISNHFSRGLEQLGGVYAL
jgi:hypothetical protein